MNFDPYAQNGGTALGIAGKDYVLLASDTRLVDEGTGILLSRNVPHIFEVTSKIRMCLTGFHADVLTLKKTLDIKVMDYRYNHRKDIPLTDFANLVSICLYQRRFFPLYVSTLVAGLDEVGKGALYSYDPVGSYEREVYRACGTSGAIIQSFMDREIGKPDLTAECVEMEKGSALRLARDIFISAAERDIYCGDSIVVDIITADGVNRHCFPLRRD